MLDKTLAEIKEKAANGINYSLQEIKAGTQIIRVPFLYSFEKVFLESYANPYKSFVDVCDMILYQFKNRLGF